MLTTIPPNFAPDDTVSTHDMVEIRANPALQWNPEFLAATDTLYGMADKVKFRRDVYCLEFSFKPLRMIEVDVPTGLRRHASGSWFGIWSTASAIRARCSSRS